MLLKGSWLRQLLGLGLRRRRRSSLAPRAVARHVASLAARKARTSTAAASAASSSTCKCAASETACGSPSLITRVDAATIAAAGRSKRSVLCRLRLDNACKACKCGQLRCLRHLVDEWRDELGLRVVLEAQPLVHAHLPREAMQLAPCSRAGARCGDAGARCGARTRTALGRGRGRDGERKRRA